MGVLPPPGSGSWVLAALACGPVLAPWAQRFCPSRRTRYISTELGMRQRLFVGVLTSKSTLGTLAVAVNRTLAHRLERLVYFTGTRGRKVPHGMTVVTHGDERPIWNMYQTVRYLLEHCVNDFDWFFLVRDDTYTEAHRINRLVAHLSIDTHLYLGRPEEFIGGDTEGRYCSGGFGYLLSRSLLLRLQQHLESCRNDILSSQPDEWLGRCIIDHTAVSCTEEHEVGSAAELARSRAPGSVSPWIVRAAGPALCAVLLEACCDSMQRGGVVGLGRL